ncbi:MAG: hypothetical protein IKF38_07570 [Clostridia bacterium]|nr:hypothetical protein [Clostridia bacterium]
MLGKLFECEADKNKKYYRVIQTIKEYRDGKRFPIDEVVIADKKIDLNATESMQMGGFCVSTYNYTFRWLIRGDTLCEVIIPEDSKFYKTVSDNDVYVCEKMILTNPKKIDDNFAMELYKVSTLNDISYFRAMTACAICGYMNTALKVCEDRVNQQNVETAIKEFEGFCKRREEEHYGKNTMEIESVKIIYDKLKEIEIEGKN